MSENHRSSWTREDDERLPGETAKQWLERRK